MKLLIDTDVGADIDDTLSLLVAWNLKLDIVGITTVFKNTLERGQIVKKMQKIYGVEGKVYCGYGDPLDKKLDASAKTMFYEEDLSSDIYKPDNADDENYQESAIDFIIDSAKKYQDDLTILAIGSLGNIARAIQKNSSALSKVNRIVVMGGNFSQGVHEWNVYCDPLSAKVVFESGINVYCVGNDITRRVKLSDFYKEQILNCKSNEFLKVVSNQARIWEDSRHAGITLHDPLALYVCIDNNAVFFKKQRIYVVVDDAGARGLTVNLSNSNLHKNTKLGSEIYVATDVDSDYIIKRFMKDAFNL